MDRHDLARFRGPAAWALLFAAAQFPLGVLWSLLQIVTGNAWLISPGQEIFANPIAALLSAAAVVLTCYWGSPHPRAKAIAYVALTIQLVSLAMGLFGGVLELGFEFGFVADPTDGLLARYVDSVSANLVLVKLSGLATVAAGALVTLPALGFRLEPTMRLSYTPPPWQERVDPDSAIEVDVSTLAKLDASVDKIHQAAAGWPHPVEVLLYHLDQEDGMRSLRVALGREASVVEWERERPGDGGDWQVQERFLSSNGGTDDEPYLIVGGDREGSEPARCPAWEVVPIAGAREAVRRFFRTGQRPDNLTWRDETPAPHEAGRSLE